MVLGRRPSRGMDHKVSETVFRRDLGQRIADLRQDAKLTQAELAEELGMPRTAVGAIEAGTRNTTAYELMELARALGVGVPDLLATSGESVVPHRNRWTELARQIQQSRLSYAQLAATSWESGDVVAAVRFRYIAEGLEMAQGKQVELSRREPDV